MLRVYDLMVDGGNVLCEIQAHKGPLVGGAEQAQSSTAGIAWLVARCRGCSALSAGTHNAECVQCSAAGIADGTALANWMLPAAGTCPRVAGLTPAGLAPAGWRLPAHAQAACEAVPCMLRPCCCPCPAAGVHGMEP
jgi:hypothetical protein